MAATDGRLQFHTRVAINVLAHRRARAGARPRPGGGPPRPAWPALGVADERELAAAIRAGDLDDRLDEVQDARLGRRCATSWPWPTRSTSTPP